MEKVIKISSLNLYYSNSNQMFDKLNGHPVMICLYAKMIPGANMTLQGVWDKITSLKH